MSTVKNRILGILIGVGICFSNVAMSHEGHDDEHEGECSKDILLAYFPEVFVKETLKKFDVPKDQWDAITKELAARDRDIIKQVEAKAEKMNPNPLKDPQQRQAAVKIFRDTLLENFSDVMKAHGVKDEKQIQAMLEDIQQQKAKRFAQCMESQRPKATSKADLKVSDDDDEDDDDSDDDEDDEKDDKKADEKKDAEKK